MHALLLPLLAAQASAPGSLPYADRLPAPHQPNYVPTQAGLEPPTFDGGRSEFELGDVNADGHPDLVSVGDHGSPFIGTSQHGVMVWLGDGQGGFTLVMSGDFGYGGVALGDVDGDGRMDVGFGVHHDYSSDDFGDQLIEVALGDGTGTGWSPWDDGLGTAGETYGMFGTDFGDVDGDGDLDVGSNSFGCCAGLHVYRNHGDGTWSPTFSAPGSNSDMDFVFCDFTGDGHLDVAAASQSGKAWRGDGTGGFAKADAALPASSYRGIAAGDVDGDGADDLGYLAGGAVALQSWSPGDAWSDLSAGLAGPGSYDLTQLADLDSDGDLDVLAFGNGLLTYWLTQAGGGFAAPKSGTLPGVSSKDGEALEVSGDLDHNGYPDPIVLQDEGGTFSGQNELYALFEVSAPSELWIRLLEPGPQRAWRGGQTRFVGWASAVPDVALGTGLVSLELSTAGPGGPWTLLAAGLPNNGRCQLAVPRGVASSACRLRATLVTPAGAAGGVSAPFRILP